MDSNYAHPLSPMTKVSTESREDYLEAIYLLSNISDGKIRSSELADYMHISRPSACNAVGRLKNEGFLTMDDKFLISLTDAGEQRAKQVYERHCFFEKLLLDAGVAVELARTEACHMEHAISNDSFIKLKTYLD